MSGGRFTALFIVWLCVAFPAQSIAAWFSPKGVNSKLSSLVNQTFQECMPKVSATWNRLPVAAAEVQKTRLP